MGASCPPRWQIGLVVAATALGLAYEMLAGDIRAPPSAAQVVDGSAPDEPGPIAGRIDPTAQASIELTFADLFDELLAQLAPAIRRAMYDPKVFYLALEAAHNDTASGVPSSRSDAFSLPALERLQWDVSKRGAFAPRPNSFGEIKQQLRAIKIFLSIGLGRLHRDNSLHQLFHRSSSEGRASIRKSAQALLHASLAQLTTLLQLVIDSTPPDHAVRQNDLFEYVARLRVHKAPHGARRARMPPRDTGRKHGWGSDAYTLNYVAPEYDKQPPRNGKFWGMLRPTLHCSTLLRLCEQSDGCRLLCNAQYALHRAPNGPAWIPGPSALHFVGFGSNNEFEWEESLAKLFFPQTFTKLPSAIDPRRETEALQPMLKNAIGSVTTLDCTLRGGKFRPPETLTRSSIGLSTVGKCVDEAVTPVSITLRELRALLERTANGPDGNHTATIRAARLGGPDDIPIEYTRHNQPKVPAGILRDRQWLRPRRIAILKIDVEGYEFVVVPRWLRDELADAYSSYLDPSREGDLRLVRSAAGLEPPGEGSGVKLPLVDFFDQLRNFLPVDNLQMEFHRMGHKGQHGSNINSALHAHLFLLNMHALGFFMVGQERNHIDNCCYEFSFVHYRYFVESELWLATQ